MAITFVGAHATLSNADTVPAHLPEDTIFQCGFRSSAATIPTDPAGAFTTYDTEAANTCAQRCVYRQAVSTTGEGATLTGATAVSTIVIRGPWGSGGGNATTGTGTTLAWTGFAIDDPSGNNFLLGFANSRAATNVQTTAPVGLTAVTTTVSSSAGYTGTTTVNWPTTNQGPVNTSTGWITALLELSSFTTFSAIRVATNVSLTNKSLSSQSSSAVGDRSVITTFARQSGKFVFRVVFASGAQTHNGNGIGLCNTSQSPGSGVATNTTSLGLFFDGTVFVNNSQVIGTTQATYADGDTVYVAIDISNKLMWSKNGSGGTWTGSPDAGTGGIDISALSFTGGIMPCRGAGSVESGTSTYDGSASGHGLSSFTPWDGTAGGGDVSVSISGQAMTSAQGAVTKQVQLGLLGQAATAAQGTVVPAVAKILTGQAMAAAQGLISVSYGRTVTITGMGMTAGQGSVIPGVSPVLAGQQATSGQGAVVPAVSPVISGQAVTAAQGAVAKTVATAPTGQAMTMSLGSVTIAGGTGVTLTGQTMVTAQGAVIAGVKIGLAGIAAATAQGTIVPKVAKPVTGQAMTAAQGVVIAKIGFVLAGQAMTTAMGIVTVNAGGLIIAIVGQAMTMGQGAIHVATYALTPQNLEGSANKSVTLTADSAQGTIPLGGAGNWSATVTGQTPGQTRLGGGVPGQTKLNGGGL